MYRSSCLLLLLISLVCRVFPQTADFEGIPLSEFIQTVEAETDLTFNYDPKLISSITIDGRMDYANITGSLDRLLRHTPLAFELKEGRILLYEDEPKTYTICGRVLSQESDEPLELVNIALSGLGRGTETDQNGKFTFQVEARKHDLIHISYLGRIGQNFVVHDWKSSDCPDVFLKVDTELTGKEVVIRDYLLHGIDLEGDYGSTQIDLDVLSRSYSAAREDVLRTAQLLPGITAVDGSATKLNIRGSTPDQNLLVWEGVTLYDPGHFFGMVSAVNPFLIDQITVHKTVFDPKYDNRVGGVIDMSLSQELRNKFSGGFGSTMTEAHGDLQMPIVRDKMSLTVAARHSLGKLLSTPTLKSFADKVFQDSRITESDEEIDEVRTDALNRLEYYDITSKLIFHPNDRLHMAAAFTNNQNHFEDEGEFEDENVSNRETTFSEGEALSLHAKYQWNEKSTTTLRFGRSSYEMMQSSEFSESDDDVSFEKTSSSNDMIDRKLSISNSWQYPSLEFDLGYEWEYKQAAFELSESSNYGSPATDHEMAESDFHNLMASLGWQIDQHRIRAGLRGSYFRELDEFFISPRLAWQFAMSEKSQLRVSAGRFYQFVSQLQNVDDLNLLNSIWLLADETTDEVLKSDKLALGIAYQDHHFLVDMEAYAHRQAGISSLSASMNQGNEIASSIGESMAYGLDVLLQRKLGLHQIWLTYSLLNNRYRYDDIGEDWFAADNDHRHHFTLAGQGTLGKWQATATFALRSGLPYSPVEDIIMDGEEEEDFAIQFGTINSRRLKAFQQLDLGISFHTELPITAASLEFRASLLNALNRKNPYARRTLLAEFDDDDLPEVFTAEKNHILRTPQLMIRINF